VTKIHFADVELRDTLQGHDRVTLEMHFEAVFELIWRYTLRL